MTDTTTEVGYMPPPMVSHETSSAPTAGIPRRVNGNIDGSPSGETERKVGAHQQWTHREMGPRADREGP
jgi:hypothetical protein